MNLNKKIYHSKCPVFEDLGKKWISMRLPVEETTLGDKYELKFRKHGSDEEYNKHVSTLYFERFTDGHVLDIPMDKFNVKIGEWFDIEAVKID